MGGPAPGDWPLSAAATAMLREPRSSGPTLMALAVRELVARGVVDARLGTARRWRPQAVLLGPGRPPVDLPRPLPLVAAALLPRLTPEGADATAAVRACLGKKRQLLGQVADDTRSELVDRRLLQVQRDRVLACPAPACAARRPARRGPRACRPSHPRARCLPWDSCSPWTRRSDAPGAS